MQNLVLVDRDRPSAALSRSYKPVTRLDATLERVSLAAEPLTRAGLYLSLAVIYFWFGGMKFTGYEAEGLVPLVSNSPLLGWFYDLLSVRGFSAFLGVVEIGIGLLVVAGLFKPSTSMVGGLLSAGLFATTLSFMATTPGTFEPSLGFPAISVAPGQFLLKDIGLLAISLWVFADSARRLRRA